MNTNDIKNAFAAAGIKVRVKALNADRVRICRIAKPGVDLAHEVASKSVAASIGLLDCLRQPGGDIMQPHEMVAYLPSA